MLIEYSTYSTQNVDDYLDMRAICPTQHDRSRLVPAEPFKSKTF